MSLARSTAAARVRDIEWRTVALLGPLALLEGLVFAVPLGYLVRLSLTGRTERGAFEPGTVTFEGYRYLVESPVVREVASFTVWFAVVVTAVAVVLGTGYAYAAWRADGLVRTLLLAGVVVSLLTTLVVRLFAVVLVYSPVGPLNDLLVGLGAVGEPLLLINNAVGAVLAQLYVVVPYAVLAVYSVLEGLDERLVEAARDLGAGRGRAVREVVIPHAVPGIVVAGAVSFAWSVGAYAAPLLVGSSGERTAGIYVSELLLRRYDWPAAAALAVATVAAVALALAVAGAALLRGGRDGA